MSRGIQKWPRAAIQEIDQVSRAANVAAHRTNRFAERANLNVDASVTSQVIDRAAAIAPQHAGGMRVVDHHDAIIFFGQIAQRGQRRDISVHRKNAVGNQQFMPGPVFSLPAQALAIGNIPVLENLNCRSRKPAAIDDGGVIQFIGKNQIVFAKDGRDRSRIRREAGLKNDGGFCPFEFCNLFFDRRKCSPLASNSAS